MPLTMKTARHAVLAFAAPVLISGFVHAAAPAPAAPDFSKVEIKATDLGSKTYMLEGQGGNITVAVGDDGIIMVDTQFAPLHDKIKAAVTKLSPQPIKYIVNTHYHGDHTGGVGPFQKDGAVVVAHANINKRLAAPVANALTGATPPAMSGDALPKQPYNVATTSVMVRGRAAQVMHQPAAHTDGDSAVYFADANVLATGDIVSIGNRYPNIDVAVGGNVKGMIAAVDNYLKISNDTTKIVPGHGALMNKAQLTAYRDMMVAARDRVAKLIGEGKSEDDVVNAKPIADLQKQAGADDTATANFLRLIYRSLKA